jgi:thioredoxin 2
VSTAIAATTVQCANCGRRNRVPDVATGAPRCGQCHQPLPWIVDAADASFAEVADGATLPVIVDLWAPWCGPCRMVSPVLAEVARDFAGRVKLVKVNVDDNPVISQRFGVQAVPTLLVLDRGRVIAQQAGAAPTQILRRWVNDALARVDGSAP